jgi:DNA replication protein DnaC
MPLFNEAAHAALLAPAPVHLAPGRAHGCGRCTYGLLDPPKLRGDRPLYQERLGQHRVGELRTCDCEAGRAYAAWLTVAETRARLQAEDEADLPRRLAEARQERIFGAAGIPARYAAFTLDGFERLASADPGKHAAVQALRHYQQHGYVSHAGEPKRSLLLWGSPAMGKTGSLSPLFTHLVRGGATGLWLQYNQLMAEMRNFEDGKVDARMSACQSVHYLLIDDLGDPSAAKVATDYARDVLFRIVDYRTSREMPLFITTNLSPDGLVSQFDERTARRLMAACAVIHLGGKTLR